MDSWRIISGGDDKTLKVCPTNEFSNFHVFYKRGGRILCGVQALPCVILDTSRGA